MMGVVSCTCMPHTLKMAIKSVWSNVDRNHSAVIIPAQHVYCVQGKDAILPPVSPDVVILRKRREIYYQEGVPG